MKIKHKIILIVVSSILAFIFLWGCAVFLSKEPNPFSWPAEGRAGLLFIWFMSIVGIAMAVSFIEEMRGN